MVKHTLEELTTLSDKDLSALVEQTIQSDETGVVSYEFIYLNEWLDNFYSNTYLIKRLNAIMVVPREIYKEAAKRWQKNISNN